MRSNDDVVCRPYIDKSSEFFYLIRDIEERLEQLARKFDGFKNEMNKDIRDIANVLKKIKNDLTK